MSYKDLLLPSLKPLMKILILIRVAGNFNFGKMRFYKKYDRERANLKPFIFFVQYFFPNRMKKRERKERNNDGYVNNYITVTMKNNNNQIYDNNTRSSGPANFTRS